MDLEFSKNLLRIQGRIRILKKKIQGKEQEVSKRLEGRGVIQETLNRLVEKENKPLLEELEILETQKQFVQQLYTFVISGILAVAAISGAVYTALTYSNTIEDRKNLNRPYIDLDAKSIEEKLIRMSEMIPVGENYREIPAEKNLKFSIKNYGVLPAKYKIDFSDFKDHQFNTISELVDIDYLYPDQNKDLTFIFDYDSRAALGRMSEAVENGEDLFGDLSKIENEYIIKIKYGFVYQSEAELPFETIIRRRYFRVPCDNGSDLKDPNSSCWRHRWIVEEVN